MTFDIVIQPEIAQYLTLIFIWIMFGTLMWIFSIFEGYRGWYAIFRGYAGVGILLFLIFVLVSLFIPSSLNIQIINVSVGAP
jgi:hypothetical protein